METIQEETQSFNIDLASGMCDQARIAEQRRIIKLLEGLVERLETIDTGYAGSSANMSIRTKTIESAIALING